MWDQESAPANRPTLTTIPVVIFRVVVSRLTGLPPVLP
jgi:hypothetical protein